MFKHLSCMVLGVATVVGVGLLAGCPAGGIGDSTGTTGGDSNSPSTGLLIGRVLTVGGDPVAKATVTLSDGTVSTTGDNGFYSFSNFTAGEIVVARFIANGFASTSKSLTAVRRDMATPVCVFMAEVGEVTTIDADSQASQRVGESTVTLAAGSLVDADGNLVTGDVELTTTFIDPSSNAVMAFPGSFDDAMTTGGQNTTLESFGFAIYELSQNGAPVNLASGQTARIEYTLPDNAQDRFSVGDTIALWEFIDDTAMWIESGTGEIIMATDGSGKLAWIADVEHFSAWNADAPVSEKHCISGRVLHGGVPVIGAEVAGIGQTYNGTSTVFTQADGAFCVDVKRGSTVTLAVRINGATDPISTQTITVPDMSVACPGPCVEVGDIAINLDGCVQGRVTNEDGTPAAGLRVHIAPGETVITDVDGNYCGAAAASAKVAVFVESRPSINVQTSDSGACGGSCTNANLGFIMPDEGDIVGFLTSSESITLDPTFGDNQSFSLSGSFFIINDISLTDNPIDLPEMTTVSQVFGECTVITSESSFSIDLGDMPSIDPGDVPDFSSAIGSLDPGEPGMASNGSATVNLLSNNLGGGFDPASTLSLGFFAPTQDSRALIDLGFAAGQTINWSFPGGADIGAFSGALRMPDRLTISSPDFTDPNLTLSNLSALPFVWNAGTSDFVIVSMFASSISVTGATATSITCQFLDTGSGTIPAGAMALLPNNATTTIVSVTRASSSALSVPFARAAGSGIVQLNASVSVSRSIINFSTPDVPGSSDVPGLPGISSNLCDLITCSAGTVCNPATLQCE